MKTGKKRKVIIIDLEVVKEACKNSVQNTDMDEVFNALPGPHAFTGCDTVRTFAGKGKVKALKLVKKKNEFLRILKLLEMNGHFRKKHNPKRNILFVIFMVMEKRTRLISYATRSTAQEEGT